MSRPPPSSDDVATTAAAILSRRAGRPVALRDVADIGGETRRNIVLRATTDLGSVIVKATRAVEYDPAAPGAFTASGLVREWTAVAMLARIAPGRGHGATFLGGDAAQGVLVFEDCGQDIGLLVHPLLHGSAAEAEAALIAHATSLGRLHADTLDCQTAHSAALQEAFPASAPRVPGHDWIARHPAKVAALLGGDLAAEELAVIADRIAAPGPWLALIHADPCPDNTLLSAGRAILIDYEFAGPAHALFDAMYARMGFPTCWCAGRVPDDVLERVERAYRDVVGAGIPAASDDDAFRREAALVSAAWMFESLAWMLADALQADSTWGIATRRARILHYLQAGTRAMDEARILPATSRLAAGWLDRLRADWPSSRPLDVYPAFAEPGSP